MGRHPVLVVELLGQPPAGGECFEAEAVGVLGELVLRPHGVEGGLKVLDEVVAPRAGAVQVCGVGGFPPRGEDGVHVLTHPDGGVVEGVARLQGRVCAGTLDHLAHAIGVHGNLLGPVQEDLDPVSGGLQVGQETEDVLMPAGGFSRRGHDPGRRVGPLADGAGVGPPVGFACPVQRCGVGELHEHSEGNLTLAFALAGVCDLVAHSLQESGGGHPHPVPPEVGGALRDLTHQRIRLCHGRKSSG